MRSCIVGMLLTCPIVIDFYTFEGSFIPLWEFIHLRGQKMRLLVAGSHFLNVKKLRLFESE